MPESIVCGQLAASCHELANGFTLMSTKPTSREDWEEALNAMREVLLIVETEAQKR